MPTLPRLHLRPKQILRAPLAVAAPWTAGMRAERGSLEVLLLAFALIPSKKPRPLPPCPNVPPSRTYQALRREKILLTANTNTHYSKTLNFEPQIAEPFGICRDESRGRQRTAKTGACRILYSSFGTRISVERVPKFSYSCAVRFRGASQGLSTAVLRG
jgi:hypothetical protein